MINNEKNPKLHLQNVSSTLNADKQTPTFDEWLHKYFKDVEQTITYADKNKGRRYTIDELRRWYMRAYKVSI
jgi:hypothetical protein